jgi:hypothetical protein
MSSLIMGSGESIARLKVGSEKPTLGPETNAVLVVLNAFR